MTRVMLLLRSTAISRSSGAAVERVKRERTEYLPSFDGLDASIVKSIG
jgi:hypothetical protein